MALVDFDVSIISWTKLELYFRKSVRIALFVASFISWYSKFFSLDLFLFFFQFSSSSKMFALSFSLLFGIVQPLAFSPALVMQFSNLVELSCIFSVL
jgi:hypothetical protein